MLEYVAPRPTNDTCGPAPADGNQSNARDEDLHDLLREQARPTLIKCAQRAEFHVPVRRGFGSGAGGAGGGFVRSAA